jgi:ABC-type multidrug transport system fused ATPase/permease subunit
MMLAVIMVGLLQVLQGYTILAFNTDASRHIFKTVFSKLLRAPASFWESQPIGRLLGRLSSDVNTLDMALSQSCISLASTFIDLCVQQAFCFIVMPVWFMLPTYVIVFAFSRFFCYTSVHLQVLSALALSRCQEEHAQDPESRLSIHTFQYESKLVSNYCSRVDLVVHSDSLTSHAKVWVTSRITFCLCFQSTVCVLVGILQPDIIGVASLALLMVATFHIVQQLGNAVDSVVNVISLAVSLQRLSELGDVPQDAPDQMTGDEQKRQRLVADGISVRIEGLRAGVDAAGPDVITNINFDIQARTKAVIVGLQGCGKTTLLNCIVRLTESRGGRVLFNGTDIQNLGLLTLRSMIGYVPQEPAIFHGTIRFNIDPFNQYPDERIWAAIQCAQLLPTIQKLHKGLGHVLTEEGANLSYGQRQLLSLARAVCQQPPVLLLDECCSAVDPRTYEAVQDTIMLNFPNSTVISTTCRMDEIVNYNHVVVIEKGTVVRQGPATLIMEAVAANRVTAASKQAAPSKQVS